MKHCCDKLKKSVFEGLIFAPLKDFVRKHDCDDKWVIFIDTTTSDEYSEKFTTVIIKYCPFCGKKLIT